MLRLSSFLLLLLLVFPALALTIDAPLSDTALEEKARDIFYEIRCVVCQGETIADSNAEVARDMRANIRLLVVNGIDSEKIKSDLAIQYGDKILMKPPLKNSTILLWFSPLLILLLGMGLVYFYFRNQLPLPLGEGRGEGNQLHENPHPNPLPKGEGTKSKA